MVRSSLLDAVIGLLALTTVTSTRPSPAPSVTRAATPMPATSVAQTSAIATTFRWVMRSAPSIEKLFMSSPSPEAPCFIGRAGQEKGSWGLPEKNGCMCRAGGRAAFEWNYEQYQTVTCLGSGRDVGQRPQSESHHAIR